MLAMPKKNTIIIGLAIVAVGITTVVAYRKITGDPLISGVGTKPSGSDETLNKAKGWAGFAADVAGAVRETVDWGFDRFGSDDAAIDSGVASGDDSYEPDFSVPEFGRTNG